MTDDPLPDTEKQRIIKAMMTGKERALRRVIWELSAAGSSPGQWSENSPRFSEATTILSSDEVSTTRIATRTDYEAMSASGVREFRTPDAANRQPHPRRALISVIAVWNLSCWRISTTFLQNIVRLY